ncbi:protocatechuate 4,5-dioxygenase beta chain [gamma proteobacterium NOR5-3]|nr:protocatechuate 4,5-dioxygenase beta chain [gamma proteobacterium NOR5-3]
MAKLIAGIGTSHVPSIGAAVDNGKTQTEYWKPLFDQFEPARSWVETVKPDVSIIVYNDHAHAFDLGSIPTFSIGTCESFRSSDEGYGPRPIPDVQGDPRLAWHLIESLVLDQFDITMVNDMTVDHGLTVPLSIMYDQPTNWPCKVIPLAVNVVQYPQPTGRRCYALGQAIRKAIESYDQDITVAIYGTGGLSHQLQGERAGVINEPFDNWFLDKLVTDPLTVAEVDHTTWLRETGSEGIEAVMWLIMRGALSEEVKEVYRFTHCPASNTNYGMTILENAAGQ